MQLLVIAGIYAFFIILVKLNASKKFHEWDSVTTTIADYTVKYTIPEIEYEHYKRNIFPMSEYTNVNYGFSNYLKSEFERLIGQRKRLIPGDQQPLIASIYL